MRYASMLAPLLATLLFTASAFSQEVSGEQTTEKAEKTLVIFLHDAWYEDNRKGEAHAQFGHYDFDGIKTALSQENIELITPFRTSNTKVKSEAARLVSDMKLFLSSGIKPENIKVIGAGRGGYIAQLASETLKEAKVRWVFVGGCHVQQGKGFTLTHVPKVTGRVLSIFEPSDKTTTACAPRKKYLQDTAKFEEITLETGLDRGFQFTANEAWVKPALDW